MRVVKKVTINATNEQVFDAFYDFDHWLNALEDVVKVESLYDDGAHQSFRMHVQREHGTETVSGNRFARAPFSIELFQTTPPPLFTRMHGCWQFVTKGNAVEVVASRDYELVDRTDEVAVTRMLTSYLERNLNCFKQYIETTNGNS